MTDERGDPGATRSSDARRRSEWPVRKFLLGQEPDDDLRGSTTAEERLEMMWPLALEAWALMGRAVPDFDRASMPVRKTTLGSS